ncbi:MAG: type II toxin-antitoxin system HicA family toxin [Bacteroidota bacterium]
MTKADKFILKLISGSSDKNITFSELTSLLRKLGFKERRKGSHHIFLKEGVEEIINLQSGKGSMAKPYQVKQVRNLLIQYKLIEHE